MSVVLFQVEISATGLSRVQKTPTNCGVSEYDYGNHKLRKPRPTRAVELYKSHVIINYN